MYGAGMGTLQQRPSDAFLAVDVGLGPLSSFVEYKWRHLIQRRPRQIAHGPPTVPMHGLTTALV